MNFLRSFIGSRLLLLVLSLLERKPTSPGNWQVSSTGGLVVQQKTAFVLSIPNPKDRRVIKILSFISKLMAQKNANRRGIVQVSSQHYPID